MTKSFVKLVRQGKVRQPQQHGFTLQSWKEAYLTVTNPSLSDENLYETGKWFYVQFDALRTKLLETEDLSVPPRVRIQSVLGQINRELIVVRQKTHSQMKKLAKGHGAVPMDKMMRSKFRTASGDMSSPDEVLTAALDAAPYVIDRAQMMSEDIHMSRLQPDSFAKTELAFRIANIYQILSNLWLQCLWRDYHLIKRKTGNFIVPNRQKDARYEAAQDYRQETWSVANISAAQRDWAASRELREALESKKCVIGIDQKPNRRRHFIVGTIKNRKAIPTSFSNYWALDESFAILLDQPFPKFPLLSIKVLIDAWRVLGSMLEAIIALHGSNTKVDSIDRLMHFAPVISYDEFLDVLQKSISVDSITASEIIKYLTYSERCPGALWAQPLVKLKGKFGVASPAILSGNIQRIVEFWMKKSGLALGKRGGLFESEVRQQVLEAVKGSKKLTNAKCLTSSVILGAEKEEIDIIISIGNTVLVGEIKCNVFPSDPIERHNYFKEIDDEAIPQIVRKIRVVKDNIEAVIAQLGLRYNALENYIVVPFILTNLAIGAGACRCDVPILDLRYLCRYLKHGTAEFFSTMTPQGQIVNNHIHAYYSDQSDAERNCLDHFSNQPIMNLFLAHTKIQTHSVFSADGAPTFVAYFETNVDIEVDRSAL